MNWRKELKSPGIQTKSPKPTQASSSLWTKCIQCGVILYRVEIERNQHVCLKCDHHFVIPARRRIELLTDSGSFQEFDQEMRGGDPLNFFDQKSYKDRAQQAVEKSKENEAVIWGSAQIAGHPIALSVFEFAFMAGSMGSVVGEKITRCFEYALKHRMPALVVSSSGGARMQEGIISLMQMTKTCAALKRLKDAGLPYVSILAHPTTGGVAASFSILGDINIAEPDALIGFAGPRVIEQTIRQKLPDGFQRANFLLEHGMIDDVVHRKDQRRYLERVLKILRHTFEAKGVDRAAN